MVVCRQYISLEDLQFFLPVDQAKRARFVLDTDADGRISLTDIENAVIQVLFLSFLTSVVCCKSHSRPLY